MAMNNRTTHQKKQHERLLLERFINAAKVEAEDIEEREAPDFIIRVNGIRIGVEVTELFISHDCRGNTMQAQESISSKIVSRAQELYQASGAPPVHVTVCFGGHDLRKLNIDRTAGAIAAFVQGLDLSEWQRIEYTPEEHDGPLPYEVSSVHALGVPSFDMAHWGVTSAGWSASLEVVSLQSRVDEKAKRLAKYRGAIAENWLLIVASARPSQFIKVNADFIPREVSSDFDRTFFYRCLDDLVLELGERGGSCATKAQ